jgi:hypothetical protein
MFSQSFIVLSYLGKCQLGSINSSNSQYGIAGSEFTVRAELVEAHSPFDKLRANGDSPK